MFVLDGIVLWLVVSAIIIIVSIEAIYEHVIPAGFTLLIGAAGVWYLTGATNPLPWLMEYWEVIVASLFGYAAIGAVWAIAYWRMFFLPDSYDDYERQLPDWKKTWDTFSSETRARYHDSIDEWLVNYGYPPNIFNHKADFFYWMGWWPPHAFWTLAHKPFLYLKRWFFETVSGMLNRWSSDYYAKRKNQS